jgi:hypothetical protein
MRRKVASKDLTPVVVGLLIVVVGSMMWKMQENFISNRRREALTNSTNTVKCSKDSECDNNKKCVKNVCE